MSRPCIKRSLGGAELLRILLHLLPDILKETEDDDAHELPGRDQRGKTDDHPDHLGDRPFDAHSAGLLNGNGGTITEGMSDPPPIQAYRSYPFSPFGKGGIRASSKLSLTSFTTGTQRVQRTSGV